MAVKPVMPIFKSKCYELFLQPVPYTTMKFNILWLSCSTLMTYESRWIPLYRLLIYCQILGFISSFLAIKMSYKEGLNMPSAPAHVFSIHYVSSFVKQTVVGSGFHKSAKSELTSRIRPKTVKENYKQTPCRIFSLKQFLMFV